MKLRRCFKTEANAYARDFRAELGLGPHAPNCPSRLARHLAIPVLPLSELNGEIPEVVGFFSTQGRDAFSAATVFRGVRRLVVHNDSHHLHRQAANIAHELSHGILGHPPSPPLNDNGCRNFDSEIEDEANWLGPAILVSEEAAIHIARQKIHMTEACQSYGVSDELMRMRLNVTGAYSRVARQRGKVGGR